MTPAEIREARLRLGLSRKQIAGELGLSERTFDEWERERTRNPAPRWLERALRDLERERMPQ